MWRMNTTAIYEVVDAAYQRKWLGTDNSRLNHPVTDHGTEVKFKGRRGREEKEIEGNCRASRSTTTRRSLSRAAGGSV